MKSRIKIYIFIVLISIIFCIPLFSKDINIYRDDGIQHICRLMGTYQSITEGSGSIMANFCNSFGYSWNIFYSPLTSYIPMIFSLFTNSFVVILKCFMVFITIASGITMYEFIFKITKNKFAGLLGSTLYIFMPYRFTDMYIRVAIAELTSFIFIPMIFHGLYNIYSNDEKDREKTGLLLAVGASMLILTHTVIAMYTAIFAGIYVLMNIKRIKDKVVLKKLLISILCVLLLTSFYIAPMLEHKLNTNYEVFKQDRMLDYDKMEYFKTSILQLLYTPKGGFAVEIGLVTLIGLVLTILAYKKVDKKYKNIYIFSLVAGIISVIITMRWFPFEKLPSILKMLQFPFRMFEFSGFFFGIVVAINYTLIIKNFGKKDVIFLSIVTILLTVPLIKNLNYETKYSEEVLWPAVKVTENTKRVHAGCATFEYLPSKAFENLEYIKLRENSVYILNGKASILNEEKNSTNMKFDVSNVSQNTVLELPYIYYLGYEIILDTENQSIKLDVQESEKGFLQINLPEIKKGSIIVKYTGTNTAKVSMAISILTILLLGTCLIVKSIRKRNKV